MQKVTYLNRADSHKEDETTTHSLLEAARKQARKLVPTNPEAARNLFRHAGILAQELHRTFSDREHLCGYCIRQYCAGWVRQGFALKRDEKTIALPRRAVVASVWDAVTVCIEATTEPKHIYDAFGYSMPKPLE